MKAIPESIELSNLSTNGQFGLEKQAFTPDSNGIIAEIRLELPKFKKGIYYRPFSSKLAAGNRVEPLWFAHIAQLDTFVKRKPRMDDHVNLGAFMMLKKDDGQYLVLLPLVSNHIGNTFSVRDNNIYLTMATYGTRTEDTSAPLISYAQSENPYEAARLAWDQAMLNDDIKENINWRENKLYPESYQYLGWCSWEHYKKNISEEIILDAIKGIKSSTIPFRWVLIDDGYLDAKKSQLMSFGVDHKKFPNGWEPIVNQKGEKIKWMGIWRNFNGYWGGISPDHTMSHLQEHLVLRSEKSEQPRYMPQISYEASNAFYNEMTADTKKNGFDMIKVDFQSDNFRYNTGSENAILGVHYNNKALEENCKQKDLFLLNCIAQQNFNVFNHTYSALIRGSVDYKTTKDRLDLTLVQNFANAFWLGHTHWLDQDMFFANYEETARLMAVARAMSGGPIYLSDEPQKIDDTVLRPLTYADGHILGTLAPGVPLPESLMQDPYYEGKAFRVIAPLKNNCAAIMAVNLNQDDQEANAFVSLKDYPFAGGMIQPYQGLWNIPEEGILLYDHYRGSASILKGEYQFKLGSRKERLFQLSPIQYGWSLIGRPDKYLSAAAFELLEIDKKTIKIKMVEDGPILLWSDNKKPSSEYFKFSKLENGLWRGELRKSNENREYIISALQ
ncbi:Sip1-related alpha-galactosidase [Saccharicrinis sp. GN24d3]|uniref:Sip1-related alpha-galactosidase n=1 Tax=Saccharicrinis sp. GN24d3 TaxID=3458416 RepID=UPI0040375BBC